MKSGTDNQGWAAEWCQRFTVMFGPGFYRWKLHATVWTDYHCRLYVSISVVTGATDGLGRAYVEEVNFHKIWSTSFFPPSSFDTLFFHHQLAAKGLNVVLISRSLFKLQNVAREIGELSHWTIFVALFAFDSGSTFSLPFFFSRNQDETKVFSPTNMTAPRREAWGTRNAYLCRLGTGIPGKTGSNQSAEYQFSPFLSFQDEILVANWQIGFPQGLFCPPPPHPSLRFGSTVS